MKGLKSRWFIAAAAIVAMIAGCATVARMSPEGITALYATTVLPNGMHTYRTGEPVRKLNQDNILTDNAIGTTNMCWSYVHPAFGTAASLAERLGVALNPDGSLKESAASALVSEWVLEKGDVAFSSPSSFSVSGDKTLIYAKQRRLKVQLATGPIYQKVSSSSYAAGQTTVTLAASVLDDTMSAVRYGIDSRRAYGAAAAELTGINDQSQPMVPQAWDAIVAQDGTGDFTGPYAAFAAGATTVYVKRGTYVLASRVTVPEGGVLSGEGRRLTVIDCDTVPAGSAIVASEGAKVTSMKLMRDAQGETGLYLSDYALAEDVLVSNFDVGIEVGGADASLVGCRIDSCDGAGKGVTISGAAGALIGGNIFTSNTTDVYIGSGSAGTALIGNRPIGSLVIDDDGTGTRAVLEGKWLGRADIIADAVGADELDDSDDYVVDELTATTKVTTASFKMATGATSGYVMASDASGNGTWQDIASGQVFKGAVMMSGWPLGGSDGHRPVVDGTPNEGWHLCNGETVDGQVMYDLRDRFVVGAGSIYAVGATGGAATVSHTHGAGSLAGASHSHSITNHYHTWPPTTMNFTSGGPSAQVNVAAGSNYGVATNLHTHSTSIGGDSICTSNSKVASSGASGVTITGSTAASAAGAASENRPPYYALYYVQKL